MMSLGRQIVRIRSDFAITLVFTELLLIFLVELKAFVLSPPTRAFLQFLFFLLFLTLAFAFVLIFLFAFLLVPLALEVVDATLFTFAMLSWLGQVADVGAVRTGVQ